MLVVALVSLDALAAGAFPLQHHIQTAVQSVRIGQPGEQLPKCVGITKGKVKIRQVPAGRRALPRAPRPRRPPSPPAHRLRVAHAEALPGRGARGGARLQGPGGGVPQESSLAVPGLGAVGAAAAAAAAAAAGGGREGGRGGGEEPGRGGRRLPHARQQLRLRGLRLLGRRLLLLSGPREFGLGAEPQVIREQDREKQERCQGQSPFLSPL